MRTTLKVDDLSQQQKDEIKNLYWYTSEYVDNIAKIYNICKNDIKKISGEIIVKCIQCNITDVRNTNRFSRENPICDICPKCSDINDIDTTITILSGLLGNMNFIKDKCLDVNEEDYKIIHGEVLRLLYAFRIGSIENLSSRINHVTRIFEIF